MVSHCADFSWWTVAAAKPQSVLMGNTGGIARQLPNFN